MSRSKWMLALCVVGMLGVFGCSSDDAKDVLEGEAAGAATEAALEDAVNDIIVPLSELTDGLFELIESGGVMSATAGVGCPITSGVCAGEGSLVCTEGEGGLEFDFTNCDVSDGGDPFTLDGMVTVVPSNPVVMTLAGLSVNGGPGITGSMTLNEDTCAATWDIDTSDGSSVTGTMTQCDEDENPQSGSSLTVTVNVSGEGTLVMVITFDGSNTASADATLNGSPYATCDLTLEPLDASCEGS